MRAWEEREIERQKAFAEGEGSWNRDGPKLKEKMTF